MYGHSPMQALVGKDLEVPGCLLEQAERDPVSNPMRMKGEDNFSRNHIIREAARQA